MAKHRTHSLEFKRPTAVMQSSCDAALTYFQ